MPPFAGVAVKVVIAPSHTVSLVPDEILTEGTTTGRILIIASPVMLLLQPVAIFTAAIEYVPGVV